MNKHHSHVVDTMRPFNEIAQALMAFSAMEIIGPHGIALVLCVAYEQARKGTSTVELWNNDLSNMLNLRSPRAMAANRENCVKAGWLEYEYRGTRQAGIYSAIRPIPVPK